MVTLVGVFTIAWAIGYAVGHQVFMIRQGFNAAT